MRTPHFSEGRQRESSLVNRYTPCNSLVPANLVVFRANRHAVLSTTGRSVPWVDADFNYEIPGGMEPGETQKWDLSPNLFDSDWAHAKDASSNAVLKVTVVI